MHTAILSTILQFLTITMPGAQSPGIVVPNGAAQIAGREWVTIDEAVYSPFPQFELAGYSVTLDGHPCRVYQVAPGGLSFVVPAETGMGRRQVTVTGRGWLHFLDVEVRPYYPQVIVQRPAGEGDPRCCAVAESLSTTVLFPLIYNGTPIPVGYGRLNYVGLITAGILTGQGEDLPITVTLTQGHLRYSTFALMVVPRVGWPGVTSVMFLAPPCVNGEYEARVSVGEYVSNPALLRFASDCAQPVSIERTMPMLRGTIR